jgi:NAD(P)-dependent dehydrogenase (short-subunit alcohol dehydrogenase family)
MIPYTSLIGKNAIITGGAQGLGYGTAQVLADAGARIFVFDLQEDKAQEAAASLPGEGHQAFALDITDAESRQAAIQVVHQQVGNIDVLVNNAGIQYHSPAEDIDEEQWHHLFNVNLHSVMFMSRDVGRVMLANRGGSIINIGSIVSVTAMPRRAPYTTAKTAILGLTKTLAVEWASRGIRVNAVCPGYHETALLQEYVQRGVLDVERIKKRIPMGRLGTIEDVGKAVLFFACDLSSYVTGQYLLIDGGYTSFGATEDAN